MSSGKTVEKLRKSRGEDGSGPSNGTSARRHLPGKSTRDQLADSSDDDFGQRPSAAWPASAILTARPTMIKTTNRKTGRRHQSKLEDLETEELENYIKDKLNDKKITTKNAFSIDVIECETEIVKRPDFSQATNAEASTEGLKNHANVLDFCGKVYGHRVENTYRATTDLSEDLLRARDGKSLKGSKHKHDEDNDEEGIGGAGDGVGAEDEPAVEQSKWKKGRKARKSERKSHVVERSALCCPETDTNANLISRYWTLIGNVQPGAMKDTWIHQGERLEDSRSVQYVMDPDLTCLQRYNGMMRNEDAFTDHSQGAVVKNRPKIPNIIQDDTLRKAEENFICIALQLLLRQSNNGSQLTDCVTFPKKLEKRLSAAAENAAKKQPRFRPPGLLTEGIDIERTFRQLAFEGRLIDPRSDDSHLAHTEMESITGGESTTIDDDAFTVDMFEMDNFPSTSPDAISEREISVKDLDRNSSSAFSSVAEISQTQRSLTPAIEDSDPEKAVEEFRMPRAPSLVPSVWTQSGSDSIRPGLQRMSVDRSSRYGSVMKETNESDKRSQSVSSQSNMSSLGRKKIRLDLTWPEEFEWTAEDIVMSYEKVMEKGKKKTTTKEQKAGDNLVSFPVVGTISTAAMVQMLQHPASFDLKNIMQTLACQTKALYLNMQKKNWLLPLSHLPMAIAELLRAFGQAYDDDYDKNRLLQRWEGQTKQDYNLSSDDESDEEPHEDDTEFDDGPLPGLLRLDDDEKVDESLMVDSKASPTLLALTTNATSTGHSSRQIKEASGGINSDLNELLEIMQCDVDEEWSDHIEPLERVLMTSQVDKAWSSNRPSGAEGLTGMSGDPDIEDAFAFAENIALKDLTGSGINITRMKSGVRKAYRNLCSWRSKYATKHLQCTLPHLTIQHIIDAIPLYLSCKDLCHVNPSVIFSCLLHLAYERDRDGDRNRANLDQKLYLCNSEDLKELYVMSKKEYTDYTAQHPHLNELTEAYWKRLLKMTLPLSAKKIDKVNLTTVLPNGLEAMSQVSLSDTELSHGEEEEEPNSKSVGEDLSDSE